MASQPNSLLPRFEMNVAPARADAFELWRWTVSPLYEMDALSPDRRAEFSLTSRGYFYHDMPVSKDEFAGMRLVRDKRVIARAGIDAIGLVLYARGGSAVAFEGTERNLGSGDILAIDYARGATLAVQSSSTVSVTIPRTLLMPLVARPDRVHGSVWRSGTPLHALLAGHLRGLIAAGPHVDLATGAAISRATAGLIAACLGKAASATEQAAASVETAVLRQIRQHIDASLADPDLGPDSLARRFHLSRAKLYRLFAPLGGVSTYIGRRRLMRIHQAITDPLRFEETLSGLAEHWGFPDRTVFSRAYRTLYGMSPSDARALARTRVGQADQTSAAAGSFREVKNLLHGVQAPQR